MEPAWAKGAKPVGGVSEGRGMGRGKGIGCGFRFGNVNSEEVRLMSPRQQSVTSVFGFMKVVNTDQNSCRVKNGLYGGLQ